MLHILGRQNAYKLYLQNLKERNHFGDLSIDGYNIKIDHMDTVCEDMNWINWLSTGSSGRQF
jgi:hypothetical protein